MITIVIKHCEVPVATVQGASIVKAYSTAWNVIGTMSLQENYAYSCNHDWSIEEVEEYDPNEALIAKEQTAAEYMAGTA